MNAHRHFYFDAGLALLVLAGCAVGPDYQRPKVDAPAFKETGNWKPAEPAEQLPRGKWWQAYGDPVLNGLEDRIEVSSNTLQIAEAQYRQAQAAATIANAALFPSISADGSANRARTPARGAAPASIGNTFGAGLAASWEFDLWGQVRRSAEAGRAAAEASAADLESVRLSLHATLAQTYFSLRVADTEQRLYARIVADYARFLENDAEPLRAGRRHPGGRRRGRIPAEDRAGPGHRPQPCSGPNWNTPSRCSSDSPRRPSPCHPPI